jgi:hypothetical protein
MKLRLRALHLLITKESLRFIHCLTLSGKYATSIQKLISRTSIQFLRPVTVASISRFTVVNPSFNNLMSKGHRGEPAILEIVISDLEQQFPSHPTEVRSSLLTYAADYLRQNLSFEAATAAFVSLVGASDPLNRLRDILDVTDDPIVPTEDDEDPNAASRRKMKMWSAYEDTRLLAGIYRYGVNNWAPISRFVGNSRTRAQCAQRWARGLNPRICKETWDPSEDMRLMQLVHMYGDKAWTKISGSMGNRSDVQCRYHYHQLAKDISQLMPFSPGRKMFPTFDGSGEATVTIPARPLFGMGMIPRSSMPVIVVDEMQAAATRTRRASQLAMPLRPVGPMPKVTAMKEEEDESESDLLSITHLLNRNRD